jgi:hypothetical protein
VPLLPTTCIFVRLWPPHAFFSFSRFPAPGAIFCPWLRNLHGNAAMLKKTSDFPQAL